MLLHFPDGRGIPVASDQPPTSAFDPDRIRQVVFDTTDRHWVRVTFDDESKAGPSWPDDDPANHPLDVVQGADVAKVSPGGTNELRSPPPYAAAGR